MTTRIFSAIRILDQMQTNCQNPGVFRGRRGVQPVACPHYRVRRVRQHSTVSEPPPWTWQGDDLVEVYSIQETPSRSVQGLFPGVPS